MPSRGRPEAARELAETFAATCTGDTRLIFAIDEDDPDRQAYNAAIQAWHGVRVCEISNPSTMVHALNGCAAYLLAWPAPPGAIGFMGDDHRPRTRGWDQTYIDVLREMGTGIVYGDDLLQGQQLPTQCAMTADIPRALGYLAPAGLRHMYVDNFWRDLGKTVGCLTYLPQVVIEHMHPVAGKAEWSEGHVRVNDAKVYEADERAYDKYRAESMPAAVGKVRLLMAHSPARQTQGTGVHEWRLFEAGTVPEYTRPEWYAEREHAPHLEQAGHRERLWATASLIARGAMISGARTLVDLGAGDGGLLTLLGPGIKAWGYDLMPANLDAAKVREADVRYGDVVDNPDTLEWGDIAVCTEMLEHLVDPHAYVRRIAQSAKVLVCSSPWLERPGSAYEYHTWAWDLDGYRALVEQGGFEVKRQQYVGGFQIILAVRK